MRTKIEQWHPHGEAESQLPLRLQPGKACRRRDALLRVHDKRKLVPPNPLTNPTACFKVAPMSLIRGLFWLVLFIFFTFSFVVLFEYGTHDFTNGFKQEAERVKKFCVDMVGKPKTSPSPGAKKK